MINLITNDQQWNFQINNLLNTSKNLYEEVYASYQYENEQLLQEQYQKIEDYLNSHDIPDNKELYELLNNEEYIRKDNVYIGYQQLNIQQTLIRYKHIGISPKWLQENQQQLQELTNYYYNNYNILPFYISYMFYMFYERLHPSIDGNGRLGRLIFLENMYFKYIYPISYYLLQIKNLPEVKQIYKLFSFPSDCSPNTSCVENEQYFRISIDKKNTYKIIRIMTCAILLKCYTYSDKEDYKQFKQFLINPNRQFDNIDTQLKEMIIKIYNESE